MKKTALLLIAGFFSLNLVFAQKYFTKTAHVSFFSEAPLENIEAHNYQASSILDIETGEVAFSMLIRGFQFEKALMQEHFNEKYMHSDKYPKATFKGKILNYEPIDVSENKTYDIEVSGDITIHGVTKPLTTKATLEVKDGLIYGKAKFPITVADFNIEIPSVVRDNIAEVVEVSVDAKYEPYEK